MKGKLFRITACLLLYSACVVALCTASGLQVTRYFSQGNAPSPFQWCTGIFFIHDTEWVVSLKNSSLLYRKSGQNRYRHTQLTLNQPHSIAYNPRDSLYYLVDTDNHRLLYGNDLQNNSSLSVARNLAEFPLKRPHDVLVDPETGWVYVLNPAPVQLFRFKQVGDQEQVLDLSSTLVYARSLSRINGKIYVIGSGSGKVVEVVDFLNKDIKIYSSAGKKLNKSSGNWQKTGLIPNDLEFYNGFWYVTSYFFKESCAVGSCDFDKNKFIRFSSWSDFEQGNWQDLSPLLPSGLVPYFLTIHEGAMFVAVYNHTFPGKGDAIYRVVAEQ